MRTNLKCPLSALKVEQYYLVDDREGWNKECAKGDKEYIGLTEREWDNAIRHWLFLKDYKLLTHHMNWETVWPLMKIRGTDPELVDQLMKSYTKERDFAHYGRTRIIGDIRVAQGLPQVKPRLPRVSIDLPCELVEALKRQGFEGSFSNLVRRLLRKHLHEMATVNAMLA